MLLFYGDLETLTLVVCSCPHFQALQVPEVDFAALVADDEQRALEGLVEEREADVKAGGFFTFELQETLVTAAESGTCRREGVSGWGGGGGRWRAVRGEIFDAPEDDFVGVGAFREDEVIVPCDAAVIRLGQEILKGGLPVDVVGMDSTCGEVWVMDSG